MGRASLVCYAAHCALAIALPISPSEASVSKDKIEDFEPEKLRANSPFGLDVTRDLTVWINMHPVGGKSEYAVRARDFFERKLPYFHGWIRGYFAKDTTVAFRENKTLVSIDCNGQTYTIHDTISYSANGSVYQSNHYAYARAETVIPGTVGDMWLNFICKP